MEYVVQQFFNAASFGAEYALLALGLAIVFSIMGLVNFAHGELVGIGGYSMYAMLLLNLGQPWIVMPVCIAATTGAALLLERVAFRPVRRAPPTTGLLTAFGVGIIIQNLFLLGVSPRSRAIPVLTSINQVVQIGPLQLSLLQIIETGVTAIAIVLLVAFLKRTILGMAMRAAAHDFAVTQLMGLRANRIIAAAFAVSGLLAGIAAIFIIARRGSIDPFMGFTPVLKAFVACVLGGFGSLPGAVVGGFVLGFIEVVIIVTLPQSMGSLKEATVFLLVAILLVWRPQGLLGQAMELGDKEI